MAQDAQKAGLWRRLVGAMLLGVCLAWGAWIGTEQLIDLGYRVSWSSPLPHRVETRFDGIEILGHTDFVKQVEGALALLRRDSPESFVIVKRYVARIRQHERSGMRAYDDPPTFDLSPRTAIYSLTWCAGSIAHDAYHSRLFHDYRNLHGLPVPYDAWAGQAREVECNAFQMGVLRDLAAPPHEIEHLATQNGSHFDADGDGKETWKDYQLRDW